jgi:hypothetical protein
VANGHHVKGRDAFGDTNDVRETGIGGLENGIHGEWGRDEDYTGISHCLLHCLLYCIEDRDSILPPPRFESERKGRFQVFLSQKILYHTNKLFTVCPKQGMAGILEYFKLRTFDFVV